MWPIWLQILFPHYVINSRFSKTKKKVLENKFFFGFLYSFCLKHLSFCEEFSKTLSQVHEGIQVKHLLFFSDSNEPRIYQTDFRKTFNINLLAPELFF